MDLRRRIQNLEAYFQEFHEDWWSNDRLRNLARELQYPEDDMIKVFRKAIPWGYLDADSLPTFFAELRELHPEWRKIGSRRTGSGRQTGGER